MRKNDYVYFPFIHKTQSPQEIREQSDESFIQSYLLSTR